MVSTASSSVTTSRSSILSARHLRLGWPEPKDFTFQCPDGMQDMAAAGVEVANLGNNHSQDFGKEAMLDGRELLEEAGLNPVGAGVDLAEASDFARFEIQGWKVAVLGFGGVRPHDGWIATAMSQAWPMATPSRR